MKVSIIVPLCNEKENAPVILGKLEEARRNWPGEYEIIAVNDNSTDGTGEVLAEFSGRYPNIAFVNKCDNRRGMGLALIEGMKNAKGDVIVWVMGDLSDDLSRIPLFVKKIEEGCDIVFGSRYMKGGSSGDLGKIKAFLSSRFSVFARFVFGINVHDITNAFRGFRRELAEKIKLESPDFAISPELAIKAHLLGYKLAEVPCSYRMRVAGKAKFKIVRMVLRYITLFKYRFCKRKHFLK